MFWNDPTDCLAAKQALEKGFILDAARILLASRDRENKLAKKLLMEIAPQLIDQAELALSKGDPLVASEHIECAGECIELDGEAAVLRERIAEKLQEYESQHAWEDQQIQIAAGWAEEGRVRSAFGLLDRVPAKGEARRLKVELEHDLTRFEKYLDRVQQYLQQEAWEEAERELEMAQTINAREPSIVELSRRLEASRPAVTAERKSSTTHLLAVPSVREPSNRAIRFALNKEVLVIPQHEVVIGNTLGECVTLPIQAALHKRHALIVRDKKTYRLLALSGCRTLINDQVVENVRDLSDGDVIELGNRSCRWRFRIPVSDSMTAVLDVESPGCAPVRSPDGLNFDRVILLADRLEIGDTDSSRHLFLKIPCDRVVLEWGQSGIAVEVDGGTVVVDGEGKPLDTSRPLTLPCVLRIASDIDEAARVGVAAMYGFDVAPPVDLTLDLPF